MGFDLSNEGKSQALQYLNSLNGVVRDVDFEGVVDLKDHQSPNVRYAVADILSNYDTRESRDILKQLARDSDGFVSSRAQRILYPELNFVDLQKLIEGIPNFGAERQESVEEKSLETKVMYNPEEFIIIPGQRKMITKYPDAKSLGWRESHFELSENGLYMPRIDTWLIHYRQVIDAKNGLAVLLNGKHEEIRDEKELEKIYDAVCNHGAWLDAWFKEGKMETIHTVKNGKLHGNLQDIDCRMSEPCFFNIDSFNMQGFPTEVSSAKPYDRERDLMFLCPEDDHVAKFVINKGYRAIVCSGIPDDCETFNVSTFGCVDITSGGNDGN